jgi:hypothetical protein
VLLTDNYSGTKAINSITKMGAQTYPGEDSQREPVNDLSEGRSRRRPIVPKPIHAETRRRFQAPRLDTVPGDREGQSRHSRLPFGKIYLFSMIVKSKG